MKYILFGFSALAVAMPSVAHAEAFNGPYIGVEGGLDNFELQGEDLPIVDDIEVSVDGLSGNGASGGIYAGYDLSTGSAFFGLEAFASYSSAKITVSGTDGVDSGSIDAGAKESYGLAGRLGFKANDSTGIYGRVGWVNTNFEVGYTENGVRDSADESESGIQYGAGLETMLSDAAAVRFEYTINDYGDANLGDGINLTNNQFRAGLSYRF